MEQTKDEGQYMRVTLEQMQSKNVHNYYKIIEEVGSGTYGRVYKAHKISNLEKLFALKQLDTSKEKEGFPITALREIKLLQKLDHINILKIREIAIGQDNDKGKQKGVNQTYIIFDYMEHDFQGLQRNQIKYTPAQIKCIMKQVLEGLKYLHQNNIIHRDIKSANILINKDGVLKIADFGLARQIETPLKRPLTITVVTLWYRAPEILLGDKMYSYKIDIWSIGCFFAELLMNNCIFKGESELQQICLIFQKCGIPTEETWPGVTSFKFYQEVINKLKNEKISNLTESVQKQRADIDPISLEFLNDLLKLNPEQRLSAEQALHHAYFSSDPMPCQPNELPIVQDECHNSLIKKKIECQISREQLNQNDQLPQNQQQQQQNTNFNNNNRYQQNQQQKSNQHFNNNNKRKYNNNYTKNNYGDEIHKKYKKFQNNQLQYQTIHSQQSFSYQYYNKYQINKFYNFLKISIILYFLQDFYLYKSNSIYLFKKF